MAKFPCQLCMRIGKITTPKQKEVCLKNKVRALEEALDLDREDTLEILNETPKTIPY